MPNLHTPDNAPPTADQLAAARLKQWHQQGEALLTFENLRSWINATGLVLFTSRGSQLPAPAPTFVEAVLGATNANPILADMEQAKSLLARLVTEGVAVPLNLVGTAGDVPDFIVAAPVFAYVFTLRGDKAWKQPPTTSGALKVSPLALAAYTMLIEHGTLSAYDLATQLGKEVTESAVLRALNELWAHLRVLPIPQPDGAPTLWEHASARFTKIMKAGANAGQPSALSALISLYLNTAIVATEDEIETFLSPLAARSRIRDVVHALMAARQLETIAVEGKTVLHVAGELPGFLAPEGSVVIDPEAAEEMAAPAEAKAASGEDALRITKFVAKPRKIGTGYVKKPAFAAKPRPHPDSEPRPDRERRPFAAGGAAAPSRTGKPGFTKPWQERPSRTAAGGDAHGGGARPSFTARPGGERPAYSRKPTNGGRPSFGGERSAREARPPRRDFAASGEGRTARREFTPRPEAAGEGRPPRKNFSKPAFSRNRGEDRPPRKDFGDARPPRRDASPRPFGERPAPSGPRRPGSFSARPQAGSGDRKSFTPREGARQNTGTDRRARTGGPPFRKFDAPRADRTDRPARPATGGARTPRPAGAGDFAGKPSGGSAAGKPFSKFAKPAGKAGSGKPGYGKPAGTFDKFKNNGRPFGSGPPARKFRPKEEEPKG